MDMYLDVNSTKIPNEAGKVIFISTYLHGQVQDWFEPYIRDYYRKKPKEQSDTTINIFSEYRNFRRYLENTFGDIDAVRIAQKKLQRIRQTGTILSYASKFL